MKRPIGYLFLLLPILFLLASCSDDIKELQKSGIPARVTKVSDGDTIRVDMDGKEETVRLLLIDTPEMGNSEHPPQPFAEEAKAFAENLLTDKQVVLVIGTEKYDVFGRLLAYVFIDGETVQEKLLREGLARTAYLLNNLRMLDVFHKAQEEAMEKEKGIWSIPGYAIPDSNEGFHWQENN